MRADEKTKNTFLITTAGAEDIFTGTILFIIFFF